MNVRILLATLLIATNLLGGCSGIEKGGIQKSSEKHLDYDQVRALIEKKPAAIHEKDEGGNSWLHIAVREQNAKFVQYLVSRGADVNLRNNNNDTPLQLAVFYNNVEILMALVPNGADLNVKDFLGKTPLHDTVGRGHFENAKYLISQGAEINTADIRGRSPLHHAVLDGNIEISNYLILKGARVDAQDEDRQSPLHMASSGGHTEIVRSLASHDANINITDKFRNTPLHFAVLNGHLETVKYLVSKGADINAKGAVYLKWGDVDIVLGCTPLYLAAHKNHIDITKYLVSQGADVHARNSRGETPRSLAEKKSHRKIVAILSAAEKQPVAIKIPKKDEPEPAKSDSPPPPVKQKRLLSLYSKTDFGRYHALVIGNNNYQYLPKLQTARSDAKDVAEILKARYGFRVKLLLDAGRSDILLELYNLRKQLSATDNLLIYYAGHGVLDEKGDEGYWLPIDAKQNSMINWVSNSSITTTLKAMEAKHVLVVADSCYSGKLARDIHVVDPTPGYLTRLSRKRARSVISSGGLEPVMDSGGDGMHSVFATAFIRALDENTDIMHGAQMFEQIRRPVMLNSDQTPEYSDIRKAGHDGGEFIFVPEN